MELIKNKERNVKSDVANKEKTVVVTPYNHITAINMDVNMDVNSSNTGLNRSELFYSFFFLFT